MLPGSKGKLAFVDSSQWVGIGQGPADKGCGCLFFRPTIQGSSPPVVTWVSSPPYPYFLISLLNYLYPKLFLSEVLL